MSKIMILDDDKVNLLLAKKFLADKYEVETQSSPVEALLLLQTQVPDLLLLDIEMPEMTGFQVMEELRKVPATVNLPVIFLTADRSSETECECFKAGAVDYIAKPFVPDIMMQRVARILEFQKCMTKMTDIKQLLVKYCGDLSQSFLDEASEILK